MEKRLAHALGEELSAEFGRQVLLDRKLHGVLLDEWDPQPGHFDVAVLDDEHRPFVLAELKLDDVDQTLWDIFKVSSALKLPSVQAAYVVAAAPAKVWRGSVEVVELFLEAQTEDWYTKFLLTRFRRSWESLLRNGRGRPTELPATIFISPLVVAPVANYPPYELRCIRISRTANVLPLMDGWPPIKLRLDELLDEELTAESIPRPDSGELAIHKFALTTNGYERAGTLGRCASLANGSLERWRRDRTLPEALSDLRCCLYFEQRRWHHYGYGFDAEAMEYVRALMAAMHELLSPSAPSAPGLA